MQGACNIDIAKTYLSTQKPAVLCLQECHISRDNINTFSHILYNLHTSKPDLATYTRKDVKATIISTQQATNISRLAVLIEGEGTTLSNVYARDSTLMVQDLENILDKNSNSNCKMLSLVASTSNRIH